MTATLKTPTRSIEVEKDFVARPGASRMELALDASEGMASPDAYPLAYLAFGIVEELPDGVRSERWRERGLRLEGRDPRLAMVSPGGREVSILVDVDAFALADPLVERIEARGYPHLRTYDSDGGRTLVFSRDREDGVPLKIRLRLSPSSDASGCVRVRDYQKDTLIKGYRYVCDEAIPGVEEEA